VSLNNSLLRFPKLHVVSKMLRTFPRLHYLMKNIGKAFFFLRAGRDQVSFFQSERVEKKNWKIDKLEEEKKVRQLATREGKES